MSLEWCDDFGSYGSTESFMLDGLYSEASLVQLVTDPDPSGSGAIVSFFPPEAILRWALDTGAITTVGAAARFYVPSLPNTGARRINLFCLKDVGNSHQVTITLNTTGSITAYRGDNSDATVPGTALGSTTGPVLSAAGWHHVEVKALASQTVGTVEVRVNGTAVLTLTGLDTCATANVEFSQIAIESNSTGGSATDFYIKDLVIWNLNGSVNNTFFGTVFVTPITPTSDTSLNWTPSTGSTGFNLIDETPPNDDTDYISAADPPPAAAQFGMSNLPADVTSVRALMTMVRARKTDGGDGNLQVSLISNGATGNGANRAITSAYTYWYDIFETDPATASTWTPTAVDAVTLKINRTL